MHRKEFRAHNHFSANARVGRGGQGELWLAEVAVEDDDSPNEQHLVVLKRLFACHYSECSSTTSSLAAEQSGMREHYFGSRARQARSSVSYGVGARSGLLHVSRYLGGFRTESNFHPHTEPSRTRSATGGMPHDDSGSAAPDHRTGKQDLEKLILGAEDRARATTSHKT